MDNTEIGFESFGLKDSLLAGIKDAGFKIPSPIQEVTIPLIMQGRDVIGQAHTGTGKTAAFGLPAMNKVEGKGVQILVIAPTRELATQVSDEMYRLGKYANIRTATVYGGQSFSRQMKLVEDGVQVVVATPGRLLDMLSSGKFSKFEPHTVVLDEADEMLDMGFFDDIIAIFGYLPKNRQTLLFSATMEKPIKDLAGSILKNPEFITVTHEQKANSDIKQFYYLIEEHERDDAIVRLIESEEPKKAIIFCRMKKEADRIGSMLNSRGVFTSTLHGDMDQRQREDVIKQFRSGNSEILVATDVASRGLDIQDVSHVYNYHIPFDPESYVHRIGRTGRAGNSGVAITLVTPMEYKGLQKISHSINSKIEFRDIPTISELKKIKDEKLLERIKHIKIDSRAMEILKELEEDIDLTQITCKLISNFIRDYEFSGPEQIGLSKKHLERIMYQRDDRGSRNSRGGRKPSSFKDRISGNKKDGNRERGGFDRGGGFGNRDDNSRDRGSFGSRDDSSRDRGGFGNRDDSSRDRGSFSGRGDKGDRGGDDDYRGKGGGNKRFDSKDKKRW